MSSVIFSDIMCRGVKTHHDKQKTKTTNHVSKMFTNSWKRLLQFWTSYSPWSVSLQIHKFQYRPPTPSVSWTVFLGSALVPTDLEGSVLSRFEPLHCKDRDFLLYLILTYKKSVTSYQGIFCFNLKVKNWVFV